MNVNLEETPHLNTSNRGIGIRWRNELSALRVGITGTPGTGKKSVGKELSKLTGLEVVSLNEISIRNKLGKRVSGEFVVDLQRLRKWKIETRGKIIVGHLLPYVIPSSQMDFIAVLRCSPTVLRKRFLARGYSNSKIEENILAEVLDLVSFASLEKYGKKKISEFDTSRTKNPATVAKRILATIEGKRPRLYGLSGWTMRASTSPHNLLRIMRS